MNNNPTAKYWKQTHHSRKNSVDQLNDSALSNHSSLSTGYNRFKFQPREGSSPKQESLFKYVARNKEQPFDMSELIKRSEKIGSRKSLDILIPQRDSLVRLDSYKEETGPQKVDSKPVKDIAKELKFLTNSLKRAIQYFSKQLKELKLEWDSSIKQLLKHQISFENTSITQLRECLELKEKEIERFKNDFVNIDKKVVHKESGFKMRHANSHTEAVVSLSNLAISKIEAPKSNEPEQILSRTNTLNSLLGQQKSNAGAVSYCRDSQELNTIKQAIKRMRQTLDLNE